MRLIVIVLIKCKNPPTCGISILHNMSPYFQQCSLIAELQLQLPGKRLAECQENDGEYCPPVQKKMLPFQNIYWSSWNPTTKNIRNDIRRMRCPGYFLFIWLLLNCCHKHLFPRWSMIFPRNVRRSIRRENDFLHTSNLLKFWYYKVSEHIMIPLCNDGKSLESICSYRFNKIW